jgi:hypothetical protein
MYAYRLVCITVCDTASSYLIVVFHDGVRDAIYSLKKANNVEKRGFLLVHYSSSKPLMTHLTEKA